MLDAQRRWQDGQEQPSSQGTVTIRGREEDGMVIVEVLDSGNQPFEHLEEETSEGLGLSLIRNLIGDLRGQFVLRRIGETTCAEVRFPLKIKNGDRV